jgi:hypothetical protein
MLIVVAIIIFNLFFIFKKWKGNEGTSHKNSPIGWKILIGKEEVMEIAGRNHLQALRWDGEIEMWWFMELHSEIYNLKVP